MARRLLLAPLLSGLAVAPARAHDLPDRISMHAFVRPRGDRLQALVRVPLDALTATARAVAALLVAGGLARLLAGRWARGER